jgi:hypothetical protein
MNRLVTLFAAGASLMAAALITPLVLGFFERNVCPDEVGALASDELRCRGVEGYAPLLKRDLKVPVWCLLLLPAWAASAATFVLVRRACKEL